MNLKVALQRPDLPDGGWKRVIAGTGVVTALVCLLAVGGTFFANVLVGRATEPVDIYTSIALSMLLTAPIFGFLMIKLLELRQANEKLNYFASYDFLTDAMNRRAFMEAVENRLMARTRSGAQRDSALLVIDVDHFKVINDRYGHQTGDLALVRIADSLRLNLRDDDLFGRLGGEEFGVFLDDTAAVEAIAIAERCRLAVAHCPFTPEGDEHPLSVSIGIAIATPDEDFISLFHQADHRLYRAKEQGRNRIESPLLPIAA